MTPQRTSRLRRASLRSLPVGTALLLGVASCTSGGSDTSAPGQTPNAQPAGADAGGSPYGTIYEKTGTGKMVVPTIPTTPSGTNYFGTLTCTNGQTPDPQTPAPQECTRVFSLTATVFQQQIANFPLKMATVWGYSAPGQAPSTPGPTLISFENEEVQVRIDNQLPEPTSVHVHGLHQPNESDGVAGVSQVNPVPKGTSYDYPAFTPGHVGSFAYHAHTDSAVQEMRGLNGMWDVLPREQPSSVKVDVDLNMTLQIWGWEGEGSLVEPFGVGPAGKFPFDTINGKTGDASGSPITIKKGDRVRMRIYNASQQTHSMHLHGHDIVAVSKNGHANDPIRETTQTVNPGDFYEIEFTADNPGNWIFHCHFPHHTSNKMSDGFNGAPVGMTRIFHYGGAPDVPAQYFSDTTFSAGS